MRGEREICGRDGMAGRRKEGGGGIQGFEFCTDVHLVSGVIDS